MSGDEIVGLTSAGGRHLAMCHVIPWLVAAGIAAFLAFRLLDRFVRDMWGESDDAE
jgi:hypothetical protein